MKALLLTVAASLALVGCASSSSKRDPAGEASAVHNQIYRLHSGRKVLLPKRSDNLDYILLQGSADLATLNQILAPEDLMALPGHDGRGTVSIVVSRYNASTIGTYQEILVLVSATPKPVGESGAFNGNVAMPPEGPAPSAPYFVWQSAVDAPLASEMDREVWGFNDSIAVVDLQTKTTDWTFRYSAKGKGLVFEGKCGNCGLASKQKMPALFTLISSYGVRRSLVRVENFGPTMLRPFDAKVDTFNLKAGSPLAGLLKKVNFTPYGWFVGESISALMGSI